MARRPHPNRVAELKRRLASGEFDRLSDNKTAKALGVSASTLRWLRDEMAPVNALAAATVAVGVAAAKLPRTDQRLYLEQVPRYAELVRLSASVAVNASKVAIDASAMAAALMAQCREAADAEAMLDQLPTVAGLTQIMNNALIPVHKAAELQRILESTVENTVNPVIPAQIIFNPDGRMEIK